MTRSPPRPQHASRHPPPDACGVPREPGVRGVTEQSHTREAADARGA